MCRKRNQVANDVNIFALFKTTDFVQARALE